LRRRPLTSDPGGASSVLIASADVATASFTVASGQRVVAPSARSHRAAAFPQRAPPPRVMTHCLRFWRRIQFRFVHCGATRPAISGTVSAAPEPAPRRAGAFPLHPSPPPSRPAFVRGLQRYITRPDFLTLRYRRRALIASFPAAPGTGEAAASEHDTSQVPTHSLRSAGVLTAAERQRLGITAPHMLPSTGSESLGLCDSTFGLNSPPRTITVYASSARRRYERNSRPGRSARPYPCGPAPAWNAPAFAWRHPCPDSVIRSPLRDRGTRWRRPSKSARARTSMPNRRVRIKPRSPASEAEISSADPAGMNGPNLPMEPACRAAASKIAPMVVMIAPLSSSRPFLPRPPTTAIRVKLFHDWQAPYGELRFRLRRLCFVGRFHHDFRPRLGATIPSVPWGGGGGRLRHAVFLQSLRTQWAAISADTVWGWRRARWRPLTLPPSLSSSSLEHSSALCNALDFLAPIP